VDVESLISAIYPLDNGLAAFEQAQEKGTLKVLLDLYRPSTSSGHGNGGK